ncbi:Ig-like domain-containing protein [Agromyces archimandritae]|uniref:Fibronectin type III domain-containing protein n=1 Tax=Agromyces archimandritae TaxID=2781962 RepID=A0A975FN03_9MICO|nr:Ig-like domain-containing protein [Agromyces archimandritae]QTX05140.1 fibronectin type III domain-containing protein [Agromyces archimandritae]
MKPARRRLRRLAFGTAVVAAVALAATVIVTADGTTTRRMDLGDAAVWVANEHLHAVGRANTAVLELNSIVETGADRAVVAQRGADVLVLDPERAGIDVIDPVTSAVTATVAAPPDTRTLAIAGSRAVIGADGDVWIVPLGELERFDSGSEPDLGFGPGTLLSVDDDGMLFAFTPATGVLARVDAADSDRVAERWTLDVDADHEYRLSSAGGRWAVYDVDERGLRTAERTIALPGNMSDVSLQEASAVGDRLAIAHRSGLIETNLADGSLSRPVEGRAGIPAPPVRQGGCLYAAWADGTGWRGCADAEGQLTELARPAGAPDLVFRTAGEAIVLNDARSGRSWAPADGYGLIDNWDAIRDAEQTEETVERPDPDTPPTIEKAQLPPVAVDDELGARPGRSTILPVLLNDSDANGDVLVIESIGEVPEGIGVDIVSDGQQLQLSAPAEAAGSYAFAYTVGDGRGGRDTARVRVTMRPPDENSPPKQMRASTAVMETGGRITRDVLADWVDPDGDTIFLQSAEAAGDDLVTHTPEGRVVVAEGGGSAHGVHLLVSDGRDAGSGVLDVEARSAGTVPLVADSFVVRAAAGAEVEIRPLEHVRGGSDAPRLSAVPARADAVVTTDFDAGRFRFESAVAGTHLLEYSVTDGRQTATGTVRIEVTAPPDRDTVPITVPHTAFLRAGQPADADVLATDIDPMGGVLLVTSAESGTDGVRVEVVEHRVLRVTLTAPLERGSATVAYRVSNGLASADGELAIVELPVPVQRQPPTAVDDTASVRVGGVIDIPVLANDLHPDGDELTLDSEIVDLPEAGFAFVSGETLRFVAPSEPGSASVVYRVTGPDGQFATATARITVREEDAATNTAPAPATIDARVLAGQTVRVRIPLTGADADGDAVQFIGADSAPERGAVTASGGDWLEYRAGEYSAGTDAFGYSVTDALGARASGTVRVGIAPQSGNAQAPVAVEDAVTVRPGAQVAVRVLANDSDPGGGTLRLVGIEPTGQARAEVDGELVRVEAPEAEGSYGFVTTIENEQRATASSFLVVEVDADAPPVPPVASDTVLTLSDIQDRASVDVDVLRNVFVPERGTAGLEVSLLAGFDAGASVRADGKVRVEVAERGRVVPFAVGVPGDPERRAYAVIRIPGSADAIPQLRKDAPAIVVASGQETRIPLEDVVVAAAGRTVRLVDRAEVEATHSDGEAAATDAVTLRYRSEPGYFGPASIAFTVVDGEAGDPDARTAALVLPIEVTPAEGQPPSFTGGVLDFEQGATRTVDLVRLTQHADPEAAGTPGYRLLDPVPSGFRFRLDGTKLTITAEPGTEIGTRSRIGIGVRDGELDGVGGRIELRVVASTRPLARPVADEAVVTRGQTTVVDVLRNDRAANPFPGEALRVVGLRGLDGLPKGVKVAPGDDGAKLEVSVAAGAEPVNAAIDYEVADATGDASRNTWGRLVISVQDRPDPVSSVRLTGFVDRGLDVAFAAGAANNAPITGFELVARDASGAVVSRSECETTSCRIPTGGNGREHAVDVQISARNAVGASTPVSLGETVWSDIVPAAPSGLAATPIDGGLRIAWDPVDTGGGSAVDAYVLTVAGRQSQLGAASACTRSRCSVDWTGLANGTAVAFTVSARNQAYPAFSRWAEAGGSGTPSGAPVPGTIEVAGDAANGQVTVSWAPFSPNGDPVRGYLVQRLTADATAPPGGPQACRVSEPAPGQLIRPSTGGTVVEVFDAGPGTTSLRVDGLGAESVRYTFVVWGWNGSGCTSTEVAGVVVRPAPGAVNGLAGDMRMTGSADAPVWDRYLRPPSSSHASVEIVAVDARGSQIPGTRRSYQGESWPRQLLDRPYGETVRFQLRGCTVWGSCGAWSEVMPALGVDSPSLTFRLPGRTWNAAAGTWSWTGDPDNAGIPVTAYRCGVAGSSGARAQTGTSCTVPGAIRPSWVRPDQWTAPAVWLDVEIGGVVARFEQ